MRTAIGEARRLAHEQNWAQAAARFEAALAITPGDVLLRCETAYAQLNAQNVGAAAFHMRIVRVALSSSPSPAQQRHVAACLYNVGLVAEATHDVASARDAYTRSIAMRPNATVSEHLAALPPADAPADATHPNTWVTLPDGSDDAAVLAAIHAANCEDWTRFGGSCPPVPELAASRVTSAPASPAFSATVIADGSVYLALRAGATTRYTLLHADFDGGEVDLAQQVEGLRSVDLIPGGAPEVAFTASFSDTGSGADPCESDSTTLYVCTADGGVRCIALRSREHTECWHRCLSDEECAEQEASGGDDEIETHTADVVVDGTDIRVTNHTGAEAFSDGTPVLAAVGTHSVTALFDIASIAWSGESW